MSSIVKKADESGKKLLTNLEKLSMSRDSLATKKLNISGSVHETGEAYLVVENLYINESEGLENSNRGSFLDKNFWFRGSVYKEDTSHKELNIMKKELSSKVGKVSNLPLDKINPRGVTNTIKGRERRSGENFHFETLVLFRGGPKVAKALDEVGFTCYSELHLRGAVHEIGSVTVTVENLIVL